MCCTFMFMVRRYVGGGGYYFSSLNQWFNLSIDGREHRN